MRGYSWPSLAAMWADTELIRLEKLWSFSGTVMLSASPLPATRYGEILRVDGWVGEWAGSE